MRVGRGGAMQDDSGAAKMWQANYTITREGLRERFASRQLRARALPGFPIRSDEEIEASLNEALAGRPVEGRGVGLRLRLADLESRIRIRREAGRARARLASALLPVAEGRPRHAGDRRA